MTGVAACHDGQGPGGLSWAVQRQDEHRLVGDVEVAQAAERLGMVPFAGPQLLECGQQAHAAPPNSSLRMFSA